MRYTLRTGRLLAISAWLGYSLNAQTVPAKPELAELVTDRPDFTEATETVGTGVFQFEQGITIAREKGVHSFSGPELLMRTGVTKWLELRFGGDGMDMQWVSSEPKLHGVSDIEVGAKLRLVGEGRYHPAFSIIPILSLPTGHHDFTSGGYDPMLKFACSKDLPRGFDLAGNYNIGFLSTAEGRFHQHAWSVTTGHELAVGFSGYAEVFGFSPWERGGEASAIANVGLTHAVGKNAQVDMRIGRRITAAGPDVFYGFGVAFRQPTRLFLH